MKRYIYPGIGVLAVLSGTMLFMSLDERENLPDTEIQVAKEVATGEPAKDASENPTTGTGDTGSTETTEDTSVEKIPSEDPANDIDAPIKNDLKGTEIDPESPIADQIELSPSKEVRTRENGEVYFVDTKTGKEIPTPEDTHAPSETTDMTAPGKGSKDDKTTAATAYMNHLNAIVEGDFDTACEYMVPQPEITNCAERLAKRTAQFPLASAYELSKADTVSIDGDNAYITPIALRNSEGKGTPAVKMVRSSESPNGWLLEDKSLISF